MNAYFKAFEEHHHAMNTNQICLLVAKSPAPRYYVSAEEAMHQYCIFKKTGKLNIKQDSSVRMYMEIFEKYEDELKGNIGRTRTDIMYDVINSPASSFFLKDSFASIYIYRIMKRRKKRK